MWGKTEQVQTSGAQLIPQMLLEKKIINGITFEPVSKNEIKVYGTATKDSVMPYNYFIIKPGTYTLSINQKVIGNKFRVCFADKTGRPKLDVPNLQSSSTGVFDAEREFTVLFRIYQGVEINTNIRFMLNEGESAKPYEPYTGSKPSPSPEYHQPIEVTDRPVTVTIKGETEQQSITLVPPRPLTKWDKLEKIDGVWKWVYQSDNAIYDGSENWIGYSEENRKGVFELRVNSAKRKESADIFCSRYKGVYEPIDRLQDNEITLYYSRLDNNPNDNWIDLKDTAYSDVSEFKNSLFENPLTVYYETTTPEHIPLPQSEQDKLNSLTMYAPTTEITNDGGCTMELTYTVDTKSYVDTKIAEISKAIMQKGI